MFNRLETYKELIDRRSQVQITPERAFFIAFHTTNGSLAERIKSASEAATQATPP